MHKVALELDENQREALLAWLDMIIVDYAGVLFEAILEGSIGEVLDEHSFRRGLRVLRELGVAAGAPRSLVEEWDAEIVLFEHVDEDDTE